MRRTSKSLILIILIFILSSFASADTYVLSSFNDTDQSINNWVADNGDTMTGVGAIVSNYLSGVGVLDIGVNNLTGTNNFTAYIKPNGAGEQWISITDGGVTEMKLRIDALGEAYVYDHSIANWASMTDGLDTSTWYRWVVYDVDYTGLGHYTAEMQSPDGTVLGSAVIDAQFLTGGASVDGIESSHTSSAIRTDEWYIITPSTPVSSKFSITAENIWDSSSINIFNATVNGSFYSTTNGTIITNFNISQTDILPITVNSINYFSETISHNISANLVQNLKQSEILITVTEAFTGSPISNFSIIHNGTTVLNTTGSSGTIYPTNGTYTMTVVDNTGEENFHTTNTTFTVLPLDNYTHTFRVHQHHINVTAKSILDNSTILNFTVNLQNLNSSSDNRNLSTTNGVIEFPVIHNTYNITILEADGYALISPDGNFNATQTVVVTADVVVSFSLYTTNSINITYIDVDTGLVMNGTNITITFIGASSRTNITSTGTIYVDLFTPSEYTIISEADGYRQNSYILSLSNQTFNKLTLYMQPENLTSLVLIKVRDEFNSPVKNGNVIIQRYVGTAWVTEQIVKTDFNGQAEAYYVISTEFYNHLVSVNGVTVFGLINNNDNKKVIYAEDVANGITITVNLLEDSSMPIFYNSNEASVNLTYTNTSNTTGFFTFRFVDASGNPHDAELEVTKGGDLTSVCSGSSYQVNSSSTGIINCHINDTSGQVITYYAKGKIDGFVKATKSIMLNKGENINWGVSGYIVLFFLLVVIYFSYLASPALSLWLGTIFFIGFGVSGIIFKDMNFGIYMILLVLTYMVATIKSGDSGVNA